MKWLGLFLFCESTPTKYAFVQSRYKILPEAFSHAFNEFTSSFRKPYKFRGFNLVTIDGSIINISRNLDDPNTYVKRNKGKVFYPFVLYIYKISLSLTPKIIIEPQKTRKSNIFSCFHLYCSHIKNY